MIKGSFVRTLAEALVVDLVPGRVDDCWHWTGQIMANGYGRLYGNGHHEYVHVTAYREAHGEIPSDTLKLLALPYSGHPDYQPEWAPDSAIQRTS